MTDWQKERSERSTRLNAGSRYGRAKMNSLGLYTGLDMRNQTLEFMQANFGKAGGYYYWISRGVDNREVRPNRIRKSVGAENTFATDLAEFDAMVAELQPLIDKVWRHCEDKDARESQADRRHSSADRVRRRQLRPAAQVVAEATRCPYPDPESNAPLS
jgi:nucleotidyltransferase/DNA polymerase involved in DNA repair